MRPCTALLTAIFLTLIAPAPLRSQIALHQHRQSSTDLEVAGLLKNIPPGQSRFVSRSSIAQLSQVQVDIKYDENFPELSQTSIKITGVYFDDLIRALGAKPEADTVLAICKDGYTGNFSPQFMRNHRAIFALAVNGVTPRLWAARNHGYDTGPYFITYEHFVPAFHVLSHEDRPQEPAGIIKLVIDTEHAIYGAITPSPLPPPDSPIIQGFRIAQQNCFRCHNTGTYGGTKAHRAWQTLARLAQHDPQKFKTMVHNPQDIDPHFTMPPNPQYDQATLEALAKYFQSFPTTGN